MRENFYTAAEAARVLGLTYHAFLARVRKDKKNYPHVMWGASKVFAKDTIDNLKNGVGNATNRRHMA